MQNFKALASFTIIALLIGGLSTYTGAGVSSYPGGGGGGGISAVAIENDGSAVGSEATINFVPGTYTTVTTADAGSKINVTFDADPSLFVPPILLPLGACNAGPTYTGGVWMFSTLVSPSCSAIFSGFTAHNISRMNWDTQNDDTVAPFLWPSGAGTSVVFRGKFSYSLTTTPTMEASIACATSLGDMTAAPASPSEITAVALSFSPGTWSTANRLNEGTVTLTNAAFTANKACWIKLKRTDAGGGNFFMYNTPRLEF